MSDLPPEPDPATPPSEATTDATDTAVGAAIAAPDVVAPDLVVADTDVVAPVVPTPVELDDDAAVVALADLDEVAAAGLEALLFLADAPLDTLELGELLDLDPAHIDAACQGLAVRHHRERRGTEVRRAAGGWRMYSAALARPVLERWALTGRTGRLTQAALETLAVITYKQPISRADIGEIRGVNADGAVRSLVARGLVTEAGRDDGPGQAVLYGTTVTLLERLGVDTLDELPPLTDFLPESGAPDEPGPTEFRDARRRLVEGGGGDAPGAADAVREAATRRFGDVRARLAEAGAEGAAPSAALADDDDLDRDDVLPAPRRTRDDRRDDDAQMDELTARLDAVARDAVGRLRHVVAASAEREAAEDGSDDLDGPEPDGPDPDSLDRDDPAPSTDASTDPTDPTTPVAADTADPDAPEEPHRG